MAIVKEKNALGWGENDEVWKWRTMLFDWEDELVQECFERLTSIVLQVAMGDRWVWKLQTFHCYTVSSAYNNLNEVEDIIYLTNSPFCG